MPVSRARTSSSTIEMLNSMCAATIVGMPSWSRVPIESLMNPNPTANSTIVANGNEIKVIYANDPSEVDYTAYGINDAILIDNTGKWRDREGLSKHLRPGIGKVVLTAPGKGDVPNIVHGVNHDTVKPDEQILSCASCTTNVPMRNVRTSASTPRLIGRSVPMTKMSARPATPRE